jgi:sulfur carrier protein
MEMLIYVDGDQYEFATGTTVLTVARRVGFDRDGVAVAVNGVTVRRKDWGTRALTDDAWVEVLAALPGG